MTAQVRRSVRPLGGRANRCLRPVPCPKGEDWLAYINEPQAEAEVESLRECIRRRRPFGDEGWSQQTARQMGWEASLGPRGGPPTKLSLPETLFKQVADNQ
jgi:hypothetical protein